jgi:hypothetical protein
MTESSTRTAHLLLARVGPRQGETGHADAILDQDADAR